MATLWVMVTRHDRAHTATPLRVIYFVICATARQLREDENSGWAMSMYDGGVTI